MAGVARTFQIFTFLEGRVRIYRTGGQFVFAEGKPDSDSERRAYLTKLDTVFKRIIDTYIGELPEGEKNDIHAMRKLMKRAWVECEALAEAIKEEAAILTETAVSKKRKEQ